MVKKIIFDKESFLVDIVKAPVVVVMSRGTVCGKVIAVHSGVVDIRDKMGSYLVSVFEENVNAVVVANKLSNPCGEGIGIVL
jgi:hypothetical protein